MSLVDVILGNDSFIYYSISGFVNIPSAELEIDVYVFYSISDFVSISDMKWD